MKCTARSLNNISSKTKITVADSNSYKEQKQPLKCLAAVTLILHRLWKFKHSTGCYSERSLSVPLTEQRAKNLALFVTLVTCHSQFNPAGTACKKLPTKKLLVVVGKPQRWRQSCSPGLVDNFHINTITLEQNDFKVFFPSWSNHKRKRLTFELSIIEAEPRFKETESSYLGSWCPCWPRQTGISLYESDNRSKKTKNYIRTAKLWEILVRNNANC